MKNIKTKERNRTIKVADRNNNMKYFIKKNHVKKMNNEKEENETSGNNSYAINRTVKAEKKTASRTLSYSKERFKKRRYRKHIGHKNKSNRIKDDGTDVTVSPIKKRTFNRIKSNHIKTKVENTDNIMFDANSNNHYSQQMKSLFLSKYIKNIKRRSDESFSIKKMTFSPSQMFKGTFNVIRKTTSGISNIITMGTGLILLLVITLFIGVFSVLSDDSSAENGTLYVSSEVLEHTELIEKYAKEYDIADYVPLIQAVMMQESGGKGSDPMQSSECPYNKKYPNTPEGLKDIEYSIDCGVHYLSDCMKRAGVNNVSDMKNISLALQGYNFGNGYIEWAIEHFDGYTRANAKVFSDEMKSKLQVDVYGDPDYVEHVLRYYHLGNGDIVSIAKSQVGNIGGRKYWEWYGFDQRVEWCAIFVSWCANESGDLNVTIPKFSRVEDGIVWFKNNGKWQTENYIPKSGDLIFFDWNQDNDPDHVGIVENVDNQYIYTIEGNSDDVCREKRYTMQYKNIYGYSII